MDSQTVQESVHLSAINNQPASEVALTCTQCQSSLPDFIASQADFASSNLSLAEFDAVERHLALCPRCSASAQQLSAWFGESLSDPIVSSFPDSELTFLS